MIEHIAYVASIYAVVTLVHVVWPTNETIGYVCNRRGQPLRYRLNGIPTLVCCVFLAAVAANHGLIDPTWLARHTLECAMAASILGTLVSVLFFLSGTLEPERRCLTVDQHGVHPESNLQAVDRARFPLGSVGLFFFDVYSGLEFNPQLVGPFDFKMWLYLIGSIGLVLVLLSNAALKAASPEGLELNCVCYTSIFVFWVSEYLWHEHIHLYTYDLFAEKLGWKIIFGCFAFYPFFYPIGASAAIDAATPLERSVAFNAFAGAVFLAGYLLARGANNQKYAFKRNPSKKFAFGLIEQRTVPGAPLLCSGFWGVSRHINYLGEITMAVGLALFAGTHSLLPWLYPLYYVALMLPRERADDEMCRRKYGAKWDAYCALVPYRILPFVY